MVDRAPPAEATVLGTPRKTTTWLAAFVNGTLGHTLDFDDCSSFGHPSVVLVPAMLATGETQATASGRALLEAYIAGYEVGEALSRIVPRRPDQFHGLHSTAMFGPLTSATVSGKLLGLIARASATRGASPPRTQAGSPAISARTRSRCTAASRRRRASWRRSSPRTGSRRIPMRSTPRSVTSTASSRRGKWRASTSARPRRAWINGISPIRGG